MANINKVILIGRVGKDPEVRTVGDKQVASFTLATSERYKDRSGQMQESTEWHNIEYWGNGGVLQYIKKGTELYVEGSIKTDRWQGQDGEQKESKKIRCQMLQLIGSKPQESQSPAPQAGPQTGDLPDFEDPFNQGGF